MEEIWQARAEGRWIVALAGNPNVGKSTVFNSLTGLRQHTGNWPGKTVALAFGQMETAEGRFLLVDLPGTYSLSSRSGEEEVAEDFIKSQEADCVVVVCDGTALERNLILAQQVMERQTRVIVCVNLMDETERSNIRIDFGRLEKMLGVPVVATAAGSGRGMERLRQTIGQVVTGRRECRPHRLGQEAEPRDFMEWADRVAEAAVTRGPSAYQERQRRFDRLLTSRGVGIPLMLLGLLLVIWLTIVGANYPSQALQWAFDWGKARLEVLLAGLPGYITGPLLDGVYDTVARVVSVMLPPMAIFFPLFTLLEDVGYLPRVAFVLDRGLARCGACGKQALTMCMGLGCNAAGVTGCRIIDTPRERRIAALTNSFIPCNGRFPTLIVLGTVFFRGGGLLGAAVVTGLVVLGVAASMAASWLLGKTVLRGQSGCVVLELPPFRKPRVGQVLFRSLVDRTFFVAGRAVAVAAPAGLLLWCCANLRWDGGSLLTHMAGRLEPVGRFLGMNGPVLLAFLLALPANELTLPVLVMALTGAGTLGQSLTAAELGPLLAAAGWTWQTALCTMVFVVFHWPCSTTLITLAREAGGWRWAALGALLPTAFGVILCLLLRLAL